MRAEAPVETKVKALTPNSAAIAILLSEFIFQLLFRSDQPQPDKPQLLGSESTQDDRIKPALTQNFRGDRATMHLTNKSVGRHKDAIDASSSATVGAPGGIEITPSMIAAGAEVLWKAPLFEVPESWAEELAEEVLRSALAARREKTCAAGRGGR